VGALAGLAGVDSQLQSHIRISKNIGLTTAQLRNVADVLAERGQPQAAQRVRSAIEQVEAAPAR
jgi:4-carboxymuconolactone decarboxylase